MSDVRNSARYCDGQSRQHTVRFPSAGIHGADLFAAVAGQTCSDPLDCVALTEGEAVAVGEAWARKRTTMLATDLRTMFRVIPLPAGWSNDGCPAPVAMVAQPVQQQQAQAGFVYVPSRVVARVRVRPQATVRMEIDAVRAGLMWSALWRQMDALQAEFDSVHFERRAQYVIISEMATVANLAREICELAGMSEAGLDAMLQDYSL